MLNTPPQNAHEGYIIELFFFFGNVGPHIFRDVERWGAYYPEQGKSNSFVANGLRALLQGALQLVSSGTIADMSILRNPEVRPRREVSPR